MVSFNMIKREPGFENGNKISGKSNKSKRCFLDRCNKLFNGTDEADVNRKMEDHVIKSHVRELGIDTMIEELGIDTMIPYAIDGFFFDSDEDRFIERYLDLFAVWQERIIETSYEEKTNQSKRCFLD